MIVNLIVIFLILVFGLIYAQGDSIVVNSNRNRKNYIKLISVILILQSGLRNVAVGADTFWYSIRFEEMKTTTWAETFKNFIDYFEFGIGKDPGYDIFEKIVQIFFSNHQLFLFVIAIIFFSALGRFIYYNTPKLNQIILAYILYAVLFYSFFSITGHRQTIATAAALYSFEWVKKRKLIPFLITLLIASTIHKSVLLFLPFYYIGNIKHIKALYLISLLLFPLLLIFRNIVSSYFQSMGGYNLYEVYEGAGAFTFATMFLTISIVAFFRRKYVLEKHEDARFFYNAFTLGVFFVPLTFVNPSAMRVVQYFSIFMLVLMPLVVESFKQYSLKIQKGIMVLTIFALLLLYLKSNNHIEYKFFWQEMELGENYD